MNTLFLATLWLVSMYYAMINAPGWLFDPNVGIMRVGNGHNIDLRPRRAPGHYAASRVNLHFDREFYLVDM